jgi:uncharacterized DUF497 family protein
MHIKGIIWLDDIVDKLAVKHDVDLHEVREILEGRALVSPYGNAVIAPAKTSTVLSVKLMPGRYMVVFFVLKKDGKALVISARDMSFAERRSYERR